MNAKHSPKILASKEKATTTIHTAKLHTKFVHIHFLTCITVDAADDVSSVKTAMAAPISGQFRVGSTQVLISESQQLHTLSIMHCLQLYIVHIVVPLNICLMVQWQGSQDFHPSKGYLHPLPDFLGGIFTPS